MGLALRRGASSRDTWGCARCASERRGWGARSRSRAPPARELRCACSSLRDARVACRVASSRSPGSGGVRVVAHAPRVEVEAEQHGNEHDRARQAGHPLEQIARRDECAQSGEGRHPWWRKRIQATVENDRIWRAPPWRRREPGRSGPDSRSPPLPQEPEREPRKGNTATGPSLCNDPTIHSLSRSAWPKLTLRHGQN